MMRFAKLPNRRLALVGALLFVAGALCVACESEQHGDDPDPFPPDLFEPDVYEPDGYDCLTLDPGAELPPQESGRLLEAKAYLHAPCDHPAWSTEVLTQLRDILEPFDPPADEPRILRSERFVTDEGVGYIREDIEFTASDELNAFAVILRPDVQEPRPAVLVMHPHYATAEDLVVRNDHWGAASMALELTLAGYVTMSPDIRSHGRFRPDGLTHRAYAQEVADDDDIFVRVAVNDARVALSVLRAREDVESDRVGMAGLSLGSFVTLLTTAAEPDVKAAVVAGLLIPFDILFVPELHCFCQGLTPLAAYVESHELALAILPRALQIHWGELDSMYVHDRDRPQEVAWLLRRWAHRMQLETYVDTPVSRDVGHVFVPEVHIEFFNIWL